MIIAIVPLLVAILALLMYVLASNAKVVEIGRLTYFAAVLVTLFGMAKHVVRLM